jgi:hypothetical protein
MKEDNVDGSGSVSTTALQQQQQPVAMPIGGIQRKNEQNHQQQQQQQQRMGYSRYDQEKFGRNETADFQIETGLTFTGKSFFAI